MRVLLLLLTLVLPLAAHAEDAEVPWTQVARAGLEDFQASAGGLRLNNLVVRRTDREARGAASEHEFSATVANRSGTALRVVVQIVGLGADGAPTLSAESSVDVGERRNETVREVFGAPEGSVERTAVFWVRAVGVEP